MPGFDRTGPSGQGARTGRMRGQCGKAQSVKDEREKRGLREESNDFTGGQGRGKSRRRLRDGSCRF
ncbi:DUF5320 domain-containing protein [Marinilabiliaceae bacterium ANBcel2]|nr:DUF5320 domain-containing protein [Marinilabiliaceae bacterium ANBcel2]